MPRLERLAEAGPYRVDHIAGSGTLVIAFASVGHDASRMPSPEFVRSATVGGRAAVFVMDESRSWATASGFADVLRAAVGAVAARQGISRTLAIGTSMGGFAALRAGEVLPLDAIIAISPQFRPKGDARWRQWTDTLIDVTAPLAKGPQITLLHGMLDDSEQAQAFPQRKGVDHLLFSDQTHSSLAPHLKAQGVMAGLIDAALAGDRRRLLRLLSSTGGQRRQLPR